MATDIRDRRTAEMPETILIVDDDELNRAVLDNIFSSEYSIEEAENGRAGMEKLMDHPEKICAVLLDVVMPVMDGIEVLRKLNDQGLTEQIPVFLITAESGDQTLKEAYSLGVMDVILKPVVPYVVRRRINSVIELFRARKRLGNKVAQQQTEIYQQAQQIIELNMGMIEALPPPSNSEAVSPAPMCGGFMILQSICWSIPGWGRGCPRRRSSILLWRRLCMMWGRSPYRTRFSISRAS